jgi:radical SAM superfamily enzyme with C-terminal helix-hairpin-helix motif
MNGSISMKGIVVRYKTEPTQADENARLIEQVFRELRTKAPDGVRYLALRLSDDTFVHFATVDTEDGVSPIPMLDAFRSFQSGIKERSVEPPQSNHATIVGNYRMLGE